MLVLLGCNDSLRNSSNTSLLTLNAISLIKTTAAPTAPSRIVGLSPLYCVNIRMSVVKSIQNFSNRIIKSSLPMAAKPVVGLILLAIIMNIVKEIILHLNDKGLI